MMCKAEVRTAAIARFYEHFIYEEGLVGGWKGAIQIRGDIREWLEWPRGGEEETREAMSWG